MTEDLRQVPLHDRHAALGAKFAPFAGWQMPLEYAGGGVVAEHTAVREAVGVFDVSHMGKVRVTGPGAAAFLNRCVVSDLDKIGPGKAQYTMCCDDATGGVVDDFIVYRYSDDDLFLIPNAANAGEVVRRLTAAAPAEITVADQHDQFAIIAVQGPASERVLDSLGLPADHPYMSFVTTPYGGAEVMVCRTGYTGEHGYELVMPAAHAAAVWDAVFAAGEPYSLRACGLGARDTLRTEMGYPLHGQDLSLEITPVQARYGWLVGWSKPAFWGQQVLRAEREAGAARQLWGLRAEGRGVPRPHMRVLVGDQAVGETTSGTFSPTLKTGIALALLDRSVAKAGTEVVIDVRGRPLPARVVKPPFIERAPQT
ncbi:MAG TPA: glycine cleavage system aminomethyltransferase GcvT [Natronosporangium sp.]